MLHMLLTLVIGYLLGSISSGVLLSKLVMKDDIRAHGSGNAGTTNMLRVHGRGMALMTFAGDMLKGIIAVIIGALLVGGTTGMLVGVFGAVLGHNFPLYFGFKGGKGIATSFGCLLLVFPLQTLSAFAVFLLVFFATHYVSAGSVCAAVALPLFVILTTPFSVVNWVCIVALGALAIWRHKPNIIRLMNHNENKIDFAVFKGKKK